MKNDNTLITIITPTYNRSELLKRLYFSLFNQENTNFKWLIVDDGSTDNTRKEVYNFIKDDKINIEYIYKENGGKHTALNIAFKMLKTELAIIVDSDDMLTKHAIKEIENYYKKYKNKDNLCGFCFLKGYDLNNPVVSFPKDEIIANYNSYIINNAINGDKCEVFYSNVLKRYSFDEYKNEKFIAEGYLWSIISHDYDMVFINKIIYLCEYLEGGLSKSGKKLHLNNPLGGKRHALEYLDKRYNLKIRIKNSMLYNIYSFKSKNKILFKENKLVIITFIPSLIIYLYWNNRYCK